MKYKAILEDLLLLYHTRALIWYSNNKSFAVLDVSRKHYIWKAFTVLDIGVIPMISHNVLIDTV